jgi:hypothetical protein
MTPGGPFKFRGVSTPYIGSLNTPDVVKYKIPIPFAFVPPNPKYNPREHNKKKITRPIELISAGNFKIEKNCQKQIQNYNKCVRNNKVDAVDVCAYYLNYLNINCKK